MFLVLLATFNVVFSQDLISVAVIYRHGDRSPLVSFDTTACEWPMGLGQLTNLGKQKHHELGKWLRQRYDKFLPSQYSPSDVYVFSTDMDRTLMSAAANLAGLFPPMGEQKWHQAIPWQPIPIHTLPLTEDNLFYMGKPCPKYDRLMKELVEAEKVVNMTKEDLDLFVEVSNLTASLDNFVEVYDALEIQTMYNLTLPDWAQHFYPLLRAIFNKYYTLFCYTNELARLDVGPLFHEIIENFKRATQGKNYRKLLVFSGHDINIAKVLKVMDAFDNFVPPYASTVMIELWHNTSYYLKVVYKNSSQAFDIVPRNCQIDCDFDDFVDNFRDITITRKQRDEECDEESCLKDSLMVVFGVLSFLVVVLSGALVWMWCRRNMMRVELKNSKLQIRF